MMIKKMMVKEKEKKMDFQIIKRVMIIIKVSI